MYYYDTTVCILPLHSVHQYKGLEQAVYYFHSSPTKNYPTAEETASVWLLLQPALCCNSQQPSVPVCTQSGSRTDYSYRQRGWYYVLHTTIVSVSPYNVQHKYETYHCVDFVDFVDFV